MNIRQTFSNNSGVNGHNYSVGATNMIIQGYDNDTYECGGDSVIKNC